MAAPVRAVVVAPVVRRLVARVQEPAVALVRVQEPAAAPALGPSPVPVAAVQRQLVAPVVAGPLSQPAVVALPPAAGVPVVVPPVVVLAQQVAVSALAAAVDAARAREPRDD